MSDEEFKVIIDKMNLIAKAVNTFNSDIVQQEAFKVLVSVILQDKKISYKTNLSQKIEQPSSAIDDDAQSDNNTEKLTKKARILTCFQKIKSRLRIFVMKNSPHQMKINMLSSYTT